jgi:hypothetical protein
MLQRIRLNSAMYNMNPLPNRSLLHVKSTALILIFVATICTKSLNGPIVKAFQQQVHGINKKTFYTNSYCNDVINDARRKKEILLRIQSARRPTFVCLAAGSRSLNKQAALRHKLEQAKQQNFEQQKQNTTTSLSVSSGYPLSEKEIRERNDRLRFEELLQKKGGAFIDSENDKEYKSRQQEDDEIDAARKYIVHPFIKILTSKEGY